MEVLLLEVALARVYEVMQSGCVFRSVEVHGDDSCGDGERCIFTALGAAAVVAGARTVVRSPSMAVVVFSAKRLLVDDEEWKGATMAAGARRRRLSCGGWTWCRRRRPVVLVGEEKIRVKVSCVRWRR
ncbi:hypothetical protein DEO72_LG9g1994 [Vigna unguiculata]|uniref:Uncharacterized protein n=1 Tax=Vigna unguiculata TaxID=3917 RepID=A0A4D6N3A2_VIGUN|nr:hypothetical protein DEO72_LG9g1994 [Vigna unguiculata]